MKTTRVADRLSDETVSACRKALARDQQLLARNKDPYAVRRLEARVAHREADLAFAEGRTRS